MGQENTSERKINGASGSAGQLMRSGGASAVEEWWTYFAVPNTQVYNAVPPIAWTDLDLSSVIGAYRALVIMTFNTVSTNKAIAVRQNGVGEQFYSATVSEARGVALGQVLVAGSHYLALWVPTDSAGVIEWIANGNTGNVAAKVLAYIR